MTSWSAEEERRSNLECAAAKKAVLASPDDAAAASRYTAAKAAFKALQQAKPPAEARAKVDKKRKREVAPAAENADDATWHCVLCGVTLSMRDPRARAQHEQGKAHLKLIAQQADASKAAAAAAQAAGATAQQGVTRRAGEAKPAKAAKAEGFFECQLCACTVAASAKGTHQAGAKHQERVRRLLELGPELKKGDWICCGAHPLQLNYASKEACVRCSAPKAGGVPFDNALVLLRQAKRRQRAAAYTAAPVKAAEEALEIDCVKCKTPFVFSAAQQRRFAAKGLAKPRQCTACRAARKRQ